MSPKLVTRKPATLKMKARITTKTLTPELWDEVAELFAAPKARPDIRNGLANGEVRGILACADEIPVGWCSFRSGVEFSGLSKGLWGGGEASLGIVPAFHVKPLFRRLGVGQALLVAALSQIRLGSGGVALEYGPLRLPAAERSLAFSPTGTEPAFLEPSGGRRLRLVE